jgi:hypothetical protein
MRYEFILEKTTFATHVIEAEDINQADEIMRDSLDQVDWTDCEYTTTIIDVTEENNFT